MQLYCPGCQASVTAADRCPTCGDRLVTPSEAFAATADPLPPPPDLIRPTGPARLVVGSVVALGLCYALRDLVGSVAGEDLLAGVLSGGLKLIGVAVGGLLAGAGRPRGVVTGGTVGVALASLFAAAEFAAHGELGPLDLAFAVVLAATAAATGCYSGRLWPTPVELPDPEPIMRGSSLVRLAKKDPAKSAARPTAWAKILLGVVLVVGGISGADAFRSGLKLLSRGALNLGGVAQAPTVDLQLATMCILLGAAITAANTGAGFRHGIIIGALSCVALTVLAACGVSGPEYVFEGFLMVVGLSSADPLAPSAVATVLSAVLLMTIFGGWLGGQLFPPLAPKWMRKSSPFGGA